VAEYVLRISLADIEILLATVLDTCRKAGLTSFETDKDYYWNVSADKLYDMNSPPTESEMDIGQLSADWDELSKVIRGENEPLRRDLVHVSSILRAIGEKYGS
jgi:hypothetical protein